MKTLVIVESPKKAKSFQEILGKDYIVMASMGHIADLAKGGTNGIGVDVDNNFKPKYVLMDDKIATIDAMLAQAKKCDNILLASDPDREGTAIAWHLSQRLSQTEIPMKRMIFHKINKPALLKSIKEASDIDMNTVHSQEARRILDRIVGFMVSPFLTNCFGSSLSAGRVQSVVTRIVIDREKEINDFQPEQFFTIQTNLANSNNESFVAKYSKRITDKQTADSTKLSLNGEYVVSEVTSDDEKRFPPAPLITATLQQYMSRKHSFAADRTMKAAQSLYEGGRISYIRTDSVRVSDEAVNDLREYLTKNSHKIPKTPNVYKNEDSAQDAHECIYPTDLNLLPDNDMIRDDDELLVYEAVWQHFIASQAAPAVYATLKVTAHVKNDKSLEVKASGKALKERNFLDIFNAKDDSKIEIPNLKKNEVLKLFGKNPIKMEEKQTQPPPRYSEDKLLSELKLRKIGRPATYADLLSKIQNRNYVEKHGKVYHPTDLGIKVTNKLVDFFTFLDFNYTSKLESLLDQIESGKMDYKNMLREFYKPFKQELDKAYKTNGSTMCDKCDSPMVVRENKTNHEKFLACTKYPKCKNTKPHK